MKNYDWLGRIQKFRVGEAIPGGYHLETPGGKAFLDKKEPETELREGSEVEALIYHDYDGFLTATLRQPLIQAGEFGLLRVKAAGDKGAFADWGLEKDLFVPHAEQLVPVEKGRFYVMYVYVDEQTGRLAASSRVDRFARDVIEEEDRSGFPKEGSEVDIMISRRTDLGYKAIILRAKPYSGTLYANEVYTRPNPGDRLKGYIKQLRDDGKIDLTLRKPGYDEVIAASEDIHARLQQAPDNYLPFHDKSDPAAIRAAFGISKRTFKAAIGALLKQGVINIEEDGIRLNYEMPDS
jgi:predicted RNA-binding protein (virulence factor B family)